MKLAVPSVLEGERPVLLSHFCVWLRGCVHMCACMFALFVCVLECACMCACIRACIRA